MNFLQLCQRTNSEAGLSGSGPASVTSQSGMNAKVVNWVAQAWDEIQGSRKDWKWLYGESTFTTTANDFQYGIESDIGLTDYEMLNIDTMRLYGPGETISNRTSVLFVQYQDWLDLYEESVSTTGRPDVFTVTPDDVILLNPSPDAAYTVLFDYKKVPTSLAANGDEPPIPNHLQMAIVYLALRKYAGHDDAQATYQDAHQQYRAIYRRMLATQRIIIDQDPGPML